MGDYVTVTARQEGGTLIALSITLGRAPSAPPLGEVRIVGRLAQLAADYLILTETSLAQLRFTVTPATRFVGDPRWLSQRLDTAARGEPGRGSTSRTTAGMVDLIVGSSIRRNPIRTYRWSVVPQPVE